MPEQDKYVPLSKIFALSGQGDVVTGGARGVGWGIARRLAEARVGVLIARCQYLSSEMRGGTAGLSGLQSRLGAV